MNQSAYYGHESQLFGVEEVRLQGGKGDGMRLLQVRNGKGLEFTVSALYIGSNQLRKLPGCQRR